MVLGVARDDREQGVLAQQRPAHRCENPGELWHEAMRAGDFETAWTANDCVLAGRDPAKANDPSLPYHLRWVWDGRPFDGRDALVRCYHGLGDTLQFCRYLGPLRRRVRSLAVEVQPALLPLLGTLAGPDRLIPFREDAPAPRSACDLEIMELAHALRLRPSPEPYLALPTPPRAGPGLNVGLCWHVNTQLGAGAVAALGSAQPARPHSGRDAVQPAARAGAAGPAGASCAEGGQPGRRQPRHPRHGGG